MEDGVLRVLDDLLANVQSIDEDQIPFPGSRLPARKTHRWSFAGSRTGEDHSRLMYSRYSASSPERPAHYGIRTAKHKLIYYDGLRKQPPERRWEFYDLAGDPHESQNAYDDPQHQQTIAEIKGRLTNSRRNWATNPRLHGRPSPGSIQMGRNSLRPTSFNFHNRTCRSKGIFPEAAILRKEIWWPTANPKNTPS